MNKNTFKFIKKVFLLSALIVIIFNVWDNYLNADTKEQIKNNKRLEANAQNYKKQDSSDFWRIWVAISTNLWTSFSQINNLPATIYKDIFSISDLINKTEAKDELIWKNMIIIKEYLNILKTDVKQLINTNYDKPAILNAFIEQLEFRFKNWVENQKLLSNQRDIFINTMNISNTKIEALKAKIESDFKNSNSKSSLENIDKYLKLKEEYYFAKTYIIYINHFLEQYNFLNNYSKNIATVLINNKEAIIKDAFVVISDEWWIEDLKNFNLIFEK